MSKGGINEQILKCIKEICKNDKKIENFLIDIIYKEAEYSGHWHWKETYKQKIKEYLEKWSDDDEN